MGKKSKPETKKGGSDQAPVPFNEALRRLVSTPPKHKGKNEPKPKGKPQAKG